MATRWELMKATFKDRKPVSSAEIIEDIRAGAQKTLQPVVQAGARFRQEHPEAAQRISVAVRAPPKKYQQLEQKVSEKIPTLQNISQMGAKFRQSNPVAADKLYTTFQKAHAKTERVGTIEQRNALAGYTYGSYQSLQQQPVKTAAMFAVGLGSGKALSMVGKVGKAYGAGKWSARSAKATQYGLTAMYGLQTKNYIMSAPNSYVAGQRAAKAIYTELLPMSVGAMSPKAMKTALSKVPTRYQSYYKKYPELLKARNKLTLEKDKKLFDAYVKATEVADVPIKPKGELKLTNVKYIPKESAPKLQTLIKKTKGSLVYGSSVSKVYFKGARKAADIDIGIRGNTKTFARKAMKIMIETGGVKPQNVRVTYNKKFNSASVDIKADGVKWSESAKVHHAVDVHSRSTMEGLLQHGVPTRPPKKIKGQEVLDPGEQLTRKSIDSILELKTAKGRTTFGAKEHRATKDLDDFLYMASEMQRQGMVKAESSLLFRGAKIERMQDVGDAITVIRGGKPLPRAKPYTETTFFKMLAETKAELNMIGKTGKRSKPLIQKEIRPSKPSRAQYKSTKKKPKTTRYKPVAKSTKPYKSTVSPKKPGTKVTGYKDTKKPTDKKKTGYIPATKKRTGKVPPVTPYKKTKKDIEYPIITKVKPKTPIPVTTKKIIKKTPPVTPKETQIKPPIITAKPKTKRKIKKKVIKVQILNQKNLNAIATFKDILGGL